MGFEWIPKAKDSVPLGKDEGHLEKGVRPIVVCILRSDPRKGEKDIRTDLEKIEVNKDRLYVRDNFINNRDALDVKWDGNPQQFSISPGARSYVISEISEKKKFTENMTACTSLVMSGIDKKTGKNISFITHQPPGLTFPDINVNGRNFLDDLLNQVFIFKSMCVPGSIDAVIVGGNVKDVDAPRVAGEVKAEDLNFAYYGSVKLVSTAVSESLGFEPVVVGGPNSYKSVDNIYFDNDQKRLYLFRQETDPNIGSFKASDMTTPLG